MPSFVSLYAYIISKYNIHYIYIINIFMTMSDIAFYLGNTINQKVKLHFRKHIEFQNYSTSLENHKS